jgi:predicted transcriptional regulator
MKTEDIKSELKSIADHLPRDASYADAIYEIYVRMKIREGKKSAAEGRLVPHEEIKRKFS